MPREQGHRTTSPAQHSTDQEATNQAAGRRAWDAGDTSRPSDAEVDDVLARAFSHSRLPPRARTRVDATATTNLDAPTEGMNVTKDTDMNGPTGGMDTTEGMSMDAPTEGMDASADTHMDTPTPARMPPLLLRATLLRDTNFTTSAAERCPFCDTYLGQGVVHICGSDSDGL